MKFLDALGRTLETDGDRVMQFEAEPTRKFTFWENVRNLILLGCAIGFLILSFIILIPLFTP